MHLFYYPVKFIFVNETLGVISFKTCGPLLLDGA